MRQIILDDGNGLQVTTVPYDVFSDDNKNVLNEIAGRMDLSIKQKAEASFKYLNTGEYTPASSDGDDGDTTYTAGTYVDPDGDGKYQLVGDDGETLSGEYNSDGTAWSGGTTGGGTSGGDDDDDGNQETEAERERREAEEALERFLSSVVTPGGRKSGGYLEGVTDGMADAVPASIEGNQPAALSDGEFVLPADVVSHLGNGNSDAGARVLYDMMDDIRKDRTGNSKQGKQINPQNYIPRGIA
jgi:hypothetical protein